MVTLPVAPTTKVDVDKDWILIHSDWESAVTIRPSGPIQVVNSNVNSKPPGGIAPQSVPSGAATVHRPQGAGFGIFVRADQPTTIEIL